MTSIKVLTTTLKVNIVSIKVKAIRKYVPTKENISCVYFRPWDAKCHKFSTCVTSPFHVEIRFTCYEEDIAQCPRNCRKRVLSWGKAESPFASIVLILLSVWDARDHYFQCVHPFPGGKPSGVLCGEPSAPLRRGGNLALNNSADTPVTVREMSPQTTH